MMPENWAFQNNVARRVVSLQPSVTVTLRDLELLDRLVARMKKEVQSVCQRTAGTERALVYCEEWGKPLILSQTWVAELVEAAGGRFFGQPGKHTTEEEVAAADPDVIVAAWCGAADRVPLEKIIPKRGWEQTKAAKHGRVYCINDEFLNTPASTLIQGLQALAAAIHPEMFDEPKGLRRIQETFETQRKGVSGGSRINSK